MALALAALGTYGVLAYSVTERRREIGIRMALGADQRGVLGMVLGQGMTLAVSGLVLGMIGAAALTRLASTLLFGVSPADPLTFASVGRIHSLRRARRVHHSRLGARRGSTHWSHCDRTRTPRVFADV